MIRSLLAALFLLPILLGHAAAQTAPSASRPADITVSPDGTGNFTTVQAAVQSVPKDNTQRVIIFIKDGLYKEKVRIDAPFITLRGQSRGGTRIEFAQLSEDFGRHPDDLGQAVVNLRASAADVVIQNLTIANTAGVVGPHAFALYGTANHTITTDCDIVSDGADTVSLWRSNDGCYYHARCHFRGSVDFVCPRGWCYAVDCSFDEAKDTAAVWHDGSKDKDQKFVLRDCQFDGVQGFNLARHHHDAEFFFIECTFGKNMSDRPPFRVVYPLDAATQPSADDKRRNAELDKSNIWGEREYFFNCHRAAGDFGWMKDNLETFGKVAPEQITAAWTFGGRWDPESTAGPKITRTRIKNDQYVLQFSEPVTVKGKPALLVGGGARCEYLSGSGSDTLLFSGPAQADPASVDLNGGWIVATAASVTPRVAETGKVPSPGAP